MTFFVKVRVLIFTHKNRVCSIFLEFLYIVEDGNRARYLCFWSFLGIIGGTPDKRIPEGQFGRFSSKFAF